MWKAQLIEKKGGKYKILARKYAPHMEELKQLRKQEDEAYTSDLDIDLTFESEINVDLMKKNFLDLVPDSHKYYKQFKLYFENISDGAIKSGVYERFFFDLLLDSPRCEHCMAPLQNNNNGIKNHINYYHFDIDISLEKYSYLDIHRYMAEIYKYPYLMFDTVSKKTSTLCPIP
jgi:hypothetical protein